MVFASHTNTFKRRKFSTSEGQGASLTCFFFITTYCRNIELNFVTSDEPKDAVGHAIRGRIAGVSKSKSIHPRRILFNAHR